MKTYAVTMINIYLQEPAYLLFILHIWNLLFYVSNFTTVKEKSGINIKEIIIL